MVSAFDFAAAKPIIDKVRGYSICATFLRADQTDL